MLILCFYKHSIKLYLNVNFNLRHHLDTTQNEVERELTTISESLRSYEAIGMGFDKIVLQYAEIAKSIEEKRWALSQIGESLTHES